MKKEKSGKSKGKGKVSFTSLKVKLTALILVLVLAATLSVGLISFSQSKSMMSDLAIENCQNIGMKEANDLSMRFLAYQKIGSTLADAVAARADTSQIFADWSTASAYWQVYASTLVNTVENNSAIDIICLYGPKNADGIAGIYVNSNDTSVIKGASEKTIEYYNAGDLGWYTEAEAGNYSWGDVHDSVVNPGTEVITYSLPVYKDNQLIAVIGIDLKFQAVRDIIDGIELYDSGRASLVTSDLVEIIDSKYEGQTLEEANLADLVTEINANREEGYIIANRGGTDYIIAYSNISANDYFVITAAPLNEALADVYSLQRICYFIIAAAAIIAIIIAIMIAIYITKPIAAVTKDVEKSSLGDFSGAAHEKYIKRGDEVGTLASSFDMMGDGVTKQMTRVKDSAETISAGVLSTTEAIAAVTDNVSSVAAVSEELAASMEEMSATASQLSTSAETLASCVTELKNGNEQGLSLVNEISDKATKINTEAETASAQAIKATESINKRINDAIEAAHKVSQISEMADDIHEIADQTHLLSLNASIEAARAGEAGKGFAVVAEEVGKLAESSAQSSGDIQNLSEQIMDAVKNLEDAARELLEMNKEHVVGAYEKLTETAQSYNNDANTIKDMFTAANDAAIRVENETETLNQAFDGMKIAANEGAQGTTELAQNASEVTTEVERIKETSVNLSEVAQTLADAVSKFTLKDNVPAK